MGYTADMDSSDTAQLVARAYERAQRKDAMKATKLLSDAQLTSLYEEAGSISELARRLRIQGGTLRAWLLKRGIEIQTSGYVSPKSVTHQGEEHHNWKGGTSRHGDGYIYRTAPGHPHADKDGYVLEHRLVMEQQIGRYLTSSELVHHKNEAKDDNRPENLELTDRSAHMKHHKADAPRDESGRFAY